MSIYKKKEFSSYAEELSINLDGINKDTTVDEFSQFGLTKVLAQRKTETILDIIEHGFVNMTESYPWFKLQLVLTGLCNRLPENYDKPASEMTQEEYDNRTITQTYIKRFLSSIKSIGPTKNNYCAISEYLGKNSPRLIVPLVKVVTEDYLNDVYYEVSSNLGASLLYAGAVYEKDTKHLDYLVTPRKVMFDFVDGKLEKQEVLDILNYILDLTENVDISENLPTNMPNNYLNGVITMYNVFEDLAKDTEENGKDLVEELNKILPTNERVLLGEPTGHSDWKCQEELGTSKVDVTSQSISAVSIFSKN